MTKKDFTLIASAFAAAEAAILNPNSLGVPGPGMAALQIAQSRISGEIAATHPHFKQSVFLAACFPISSEAQANRIREKLWGAGA
jgi:hypothetical protein